MVKEKIILFLDIDGVLITTPSWKKDKILNDGYSKFNPACVQNLNSLLKAQDFEIWISSSRRQTKTERELNQIFKKRGINQEISGFLPISKKKISRKVEIETFIKEKEITSFLILDDDKSLNDLKKIMKQNLVLTQNMIGFNKEKLKEALVKIK